MSFARVQGTGAASSSAASSQTAGLTGVAVGDLLTVIATGAVTTTTPPTLSISDTQGNVWEADASLGQNYNGSSSETVSAWHTEVTTGGAVTVLIVSNANALITLSVDEWSYAGPLSVAATATGTSGTTVVGGGTAPVTGSLSLSGTDLVVAGFGMSVSGLGYNPHPGGFALGFTTNTSGPRPFASLYDAAESSSPVAPEITFTPVSPTTLDWTGVAVAFSDAVPASAYAPGSSVLKPVATATVDLWPRLN